MTLLDGSAQPCGCDPGANWVCERHRTVTFPATPAAVITFPAPPAIAGPMKAFSSGATRSSDAGKNDYEGFLSFSAIEEFGDYMSRHRHTPDGGIRDSDNWQKGIPIASYIKSLVRHALELWGLHRGIVSRRLQKEYPPDTSIGFLKRETACALWFNVQGYLHELLKADRNVPLSMSALGSGAGSAPNPGRPSSSH